MKHLELKLRSDWPPSLCSLHYTMLPAAAIYHLSIQFYALAKF